MSERKKIILKDASGYLLATILTQFINVASAILMRRFLGPIQVGVWSLVQMILTYSEYTGLGASGAITLEIPLCHGKGDTEKVENLKNTVFYFSLFTSLATSVLILVYAFIMRRFLSENIFWALVIASGLVVLQRLNGIFVALLRAFKQFSLASHQMIVSAVVNTLLVAFLSFHFRLYGFMIAMGLSFTFNIAFMFKLSGLRFRYTMDLKSVASLVAFGTPIMFLTLFGTLFETIDKIMITRFLGLEALGFYSISLMTCAYLTSIPNAVGIVMIPNIHEKYGRAGEKRELLDFIDKSDDVFLSLMPLFIGLAWFAVPLAVAILIPKFKPGIPALRWLTLSVFFLSVSQTYSQIIYVFRQHKFFFPIFSFSSVIAFGLIWVAIHVGWGIEGVAAATTIAMIAHFHVLYFFAASQIRDTASLWKSYFKIISQFLFMFLILWALFNFVNTPNEFLTATTRLLLGFLIYSPVLWRLNKKLGILDILLKKKNKPEPVS